MNTVILRGRLTKKPELKQMSNGYFIRICLAVKKNYKGNDGKYGADFINLTAYNKNAELLSKYCNKGDEIEIEGTLRSSSYEKNGQKFYNTDIIANKIDFVQKATPQKPQQPQQQQMKQQDYYNQFAEFGDTVQEGYLD